MNRIIKFACALLFFTTIQTNLQAQENDPAAGEILKQLKIQYESFEGMTVDFDLVIEIPEQDVDTQSGQYYQSGDKYRVNTDARNIICDGETLWFYMKDRNEVQINDAEDMAEDSDFITPKDLYNFYDNNEYLYAITNEKEEKGRTVQQIEFKPLDPDSEYFKMRLTLDKKTKEIKRLKVFSKDGSKFTLVLKKLIGEAVADQVFTFDSSKYPGIHEENLKID